MKSRLSSSGVVRGASLGEYALLLVAILIVGALGFKSLGNPVRTTADDARAWLEGDGPVRSRSGGQGLGGGGSSLLQASGGQGGSPANPGNWTEDASNESQANGRGGRDDGRLTDPSGGTSVFGTSGAGAGGESSAPSTMVDPAAATRAGESAGVATGNEDRAIGNAEKAIGAGDEAPESFAGVVKEAMFELSGINDLKQIRDDVRDGKWSDAVIHSGVAVVGMTGPGKLIKLAHKAHKANDGYKAAKRAHEAAKKAREAEKAGDKVEKAADKAGDVSKAEKKADELEKKYDKAAEHAERAKDAVEKAKGVLDRVRPGPSETSEELKTVPMQQKYEGEDEFGNHFASGKTVKYLTDEERAAYKLEFRDGKVYDAQGRPFDTGGVDETAIFVMDKNGDFYASKEMVPGEFHHSSLSSGKPVAGAGELVVHDGKLRGVTDESGHYKPSRELSDQVMRKLNEKGIDTSRVYRDFKSGMPSGPHQ